MKITIEEYIIKKNIDVTKIPILIGVFGSRGKTSTINLLESYLKELDKNVISFSSINSTIIDMAFASDLETEELNRKNAQKSLEVRLNSALNSSPDVIIFEVHELPSYNSVFENILFDIRIVTSIDSEIDSRDGNINKIALSKFLDNNRGIGVNIIDSILPSPEWENFISQYSNEKTVRYSGLYNTDFIMSTGRPIPDYHPRFKVNGLKQFLIELEYKTNIYRYDVKLTPFFYAFNLMGAFAAICEMNLFDPDTFQSFINKISPTPGRGEIFQINNSYVVIDLKGQEFIQYVKDVKDVHDDIERDKTFIKLMGYEPEEFMKMPNRFILVSGYISQEFNRFKNLPQLTDNDRERILSDIMQYINESNADFVILSRVNYGSSNIEYNDRYMQENITIPYLYSPDRKSIIKEAIGLLQDGEMLVISDRGDRSDNWINDENEPYTDLEVVNEWFEENM